MEQDYCYIDDALGKKFDPKKYKSGMSLAELEHNGIYCDADANSRKLYEDLAKVYKLPLPVFDKKYKTYMIQYNDIVLSSDYIGPSRSSTGAVACSLSDLEIGNYLKKTRKLGGHIIWPRFDGGINQSRGGSSGYFDRIDYTLLELKLWYDNKGNYKVWNYVDKEYKDGKLKAAFDNSKNWLITETRKKFSDFIDQFDLKDYVDNNYDVYDLTTYNTDTKEMELLKDNIDYEENLEKKEYKLGMVRISGYKDKYNRYMNYVNASIYLIDKRTEYMIKRAGQ